MFTEGNRADCKLDIFELGAVLECAIANSLEVFVADDTFEGGASAKNTTSDDFELIGESGTREGETVTKCFLANSLEVFVLDDGSESRTKSKYQKAYCFELIWKDDALHRGALPKHPFSQLQQVRRKNNINQMCASVKLCNVRLYYEQNIADTHLPFCASYEVWDNRRGRLAEGHM